MSIPNVDEEGKKNTCKSIPVGSGDTAPAEEDGFTPWPPVDSLFDYLPLLERGMPLGALPPTALGLEVAVIGAGAAGLVAAHELLKAGLRPVIFEATGRIGGRLRSQQFQKGHSSSRRSTECSTDGPTGVPSIPAAGAVPFAELGAMRIPLSSRVFYHYARILQLDCAERFPDPGVVDTLLYYRNTAHPWRTGEPVPPAFRTVQSNWIHLMQPLVERIHAPWRAGDLATVAGIWQQYLERYKGRSLFEVIHSSSAVWSPADINTFGALGIGTGGFSAFFHIEFIELLRVCVHQYEARQMIVTDGVEQFAERLYRLQTRHPHPHGNAAAPETVHHAGKSLEDLGTLMLNTAVTAITRGDDGRPVVVFEEGNNKDKKGADDETRRRVQHRPFAAVVVATSAWAMQMMGLTLPTGAANSNSNSSHTTKTAPVEVLVPTSPSPTISTPPPAAPPAPPPPVADFLSPDEKTALRQIHHINSSKLFIRTQTKFWKGTDMPLTIQTDELPRGLYLLDYPQTDNGVVCMSYTWGDDSAKLSALPPIERFRRMREAVRHIHPQMAEQLVPLHDEVICVDWQNEPFVYGAFKVSQPGQGADACALYHQFLRCLDPALDGGVYLAGDCVSFGGGWVEGALHTGLNAAAAVLHRLGAPLDDLSPLNQKSRYRY